MKIKGLWLGVIIAASVISENNYASQNTMINYKNNRGSLLELKFMDDNKISGFFTTAVASKSCPDAIGTKQPIVGYRVGNAITIALVYPMCQSVLAITGNFTANENTLDTMSLLNHQSTDIVHEGPGARFIGHDSYKKLS